MSSNGNNGTATNSPRRTNPASLKREPSLNRRRFSIDSQSNSSISGRKPRSPGSSERSVKQLRLSKALTIPESTMVSEACRRMATRRTNAVLLTDSSALLSGILTNNDVATRVIAEGLKLEETPVSAVMTRNPMFVPSDSSAVEALQKMVQGKFRHLPVVENGEVTALLDITKCLYDAIVRLEKVSEKGEAIAAAVQGVEVQYGNVISAPLTIVDVLREKLFRPPLESIIQENSKVATMLPSASVYEATKKMQELDVNAVIITISNNKPKGILTPKDILTRVIAQNLPIDTTPIEKVMTPNPECATVDTAIVDALHIMHDGKFLHLPVLDRDGFVVACLDVLHLMNAAFAMLGSNNGGNSDVTNTMMQKFWDSALALELHEDAEEAPSENSVPRSPGEFGPDLIKSRTTGFGTSFAYKLEDPKGRVHRFFCGTESLTELLNAVTQRVGKEVSHILYQDEEGDRVIISTDSDLVAAVNHVKLLGWKVLKLHVESGPAHDDYGDDMSSSKNPVMNKPTISLEGKNGRRQQNWSSTAYTVAVTGAAVVLGISVLTYLKKATP